MPDFMPLLRGVWPVFVCLALFVAIIQFIKFVMRRWKNV